MELNLSVDKGMIEKHIADSVLDSTLGEYIKAQIDRIIKYDYSDESSLLRRAVEKYITDLVYKLCEEVIRDKKEELKNTLISNFSDEIIENIMSSYLNGFQSQFKKFVEENYF